MCRASHRLWNCGLDTLHSYSRSSALMSAPHPGIKQHLSEAAISCSVNCLSLSFCEQETAFPRLDAVAFIVVGGHLTAYTSRMTPANLPRLHCLAGGDGIRMFTLDKGLPRVRRGTPRHPRGTLRCHWHSLTTSRTFNKQLMVRLSHRRQTIGSPWGAVPRKLRLGA